MENLYEVLQCEATSSNADIKKAYQTLALKYHPDKAGTHSIHGSSEEFVKINRAWKILSDPKLREQFNVRWAERCLVQSYPIQDTIEFDQFEPLNEEEVTIQVDNDNINPQTKDGAETSQQNVLENGSVPKDNVLDDDIKDLEYGYMCRCGGYYVLTNSDVQMKFDFVCCESCSLTVKVLYREDEIT